MKTPLKLLIGTTAVGALTLTAAPITPTYTTFGSLTGATFGGSGIPNDAVAITTYDTGSGIVTLGLTAHQRFSNPPVANNGAGTFFAVRGGDIYTPAPHTQPTWARWNFGLYVQNNTSSPYLLDLLYDFDPGAGTEESALGKVSGGILPTVTAQDSWNLGMSFLAGVPPIVGITPPTYSPFNPNVPGEYSFALILKNASGAELARSAILVKVVPEGGVTAGLLGLGLLGLATWSRFRSN